jgi:hypothetical protein
VGEHTALGPEINRLYWDTDESVAEISSRLGVSRRGLYEMIEPLDAGATCESCGGPLFYGNRSARAAGIARCPNCGIEREMDDDVSHEDVGTIPNYVAPAPGSDGMRQRAITIGGYAVAGAVVGAIATLMIRRSR